MRNLAISDSLKVADVIFYYEEEYQCVVAYFPAEFYVDDKGRPKYVNSFVIGDGFGHCNSVYIEHFRPATKAEYQQTYDELTNQHGFILNILD
jgi:hypothetical protein